MLFPSSASFFPLRFSLRWVGVGARNFPSVKSHDDDDGCSGHEVSAPQRHLFTRFFETTFRSRAGRTSPSASHDVEDEGGREEVV
jgi:hypothetical protein